MTYLLHLEHNLIHRPPLVGILAPIAHGDRPCNIRRIPAPVLASGIDEQYLWEERATSEIIE
jgi:hypothetical protein